MTTDQGQGQYQHSRAPYIVAMLVLTLIFMSPAIWVWTLQLQVVQNPSGSDWAGNHEANVHFAQLTGLIAGVPAAGGFLGALLAAARRHHAGAGAATGAFLATIGLIAFGVYDFLAHFTLAP
ncbi:hypothetical protein J1792_08685 [Streptomyces triculaminicus]|uniref:Uncharacterized protein n=2 Tax=Streptomyces TaxID=1883 RepID=A0A939JQ39_9ACTN|nr:MULTISPECIES: hypothetical protein [Streptomyces]MBO0652860.1 hypothetical protein [Streptomyces triculaminicus]QSY51603.1 hypothetical protein J3S04_12450 [Streptomyces griseocarneus]